MRSLRRAAHRWAAAVAPAASITLRRAGPQHHSSGKHEGVTPTHSPTPWRQPVPRRPAPRPRTQLQEVPPAKDEDNAAAPIAYASSHTPTGVNASALAKALTPRHHRSRRPAPAATTAATKPAPSASPPTSVLSVVDPAAAQENRELAALHLKDGYDPATVVRLDRSRRQVHLNSIQKELVWAARRQEYQTSLERIVICLQSHRTPLEKCFTLLALHDDVIQRRLRLRVDTYEDIFHTFYAVAVLTHGAAEGSLPPASAQASLVEGSASLDDDLLFDHVSSGSVPEELGSAVAASCALLTPHCIGNMWQMYRYMIDSGTDPSPRVIQYVMGILEHAVARSRRLSSSGRRGQSEDGSASAMAETSTTLLEAKAHSLCVDLDRFSLSPTEYTLNAYIGVCDTCGVMHLAVARVADFQSRHERQASAGMYARLITGLVRQRLYTEAMATVSTMQSVPMTVHLLNAVLQAARFSPDPMSTFTVYRAVVRERGSTGLRPSQVTFSILLEVISKEVVAASDTTVKPALPTSSSPLTAGKRSGRSACDANLDFLLREMRRHGVRGNGLFLSKLLAVFLVLGRSKDAAALRHSMEAKGVRVFDELRV